MPDEMNSMYRILISERPFWIIPSQLIGFERFLDLRMYLMIDAHAASIFYVSIISVRGPYPCSASELLDSNTNDVFESQTFLLFLVRFVYFSFFHPLASFPGPALARVSDVRTKNPELNLGALTVLVGFLVSSSAQRSSSMEEPRLAQTIWSTCCLLLLMG